MNTRLKIYIGVVVFMIILIVMSIIFANPYKVYLLANDETAQYFAAKTETSASLRDKSAPEPVTPAEQKELLFGGQSITLRYNQLLSNEMNAYTTEDNKVTCWFTGSDTLRLISAEGWFATEERSAATEEDYLNWIYQQVGSYYAENWEVYTKSCTTTILSTATGVPEQIERDGFVTAGEQETVAAYVFTFTKYIGQYETSDMIQAYIRPDNGFVALGFSAHNFDDAQPVEINMGQLESAVKEFLRKSVDKSKYSYISHDLQQPTLSYVEGKFCCVCTVSLQLAAGEETLTIQQQLAVTW